MRVDIGAERWRAVLRMGLIGVLVAAWGGYALYVPSASGSRALKAALRKKIPPKSGEAPDAAAMAALQREAEGVVSGAAMQSFLYEVRKRGALDKGTAPNGMSYAQILSRAQALSDEANAKPHDLGLEPQDRRPGDDDPAVVVPMMIGYLASPSSEERANAAMTMCDNRFAKWERASEAIPGLEEVAASKDSEGAEFAALALKRIRFWEARRRYLKP